MAKEIRTKKITDNGKGSRSDYPSPDKIGSRSSTVARAMASTLMPIIGATDDDRANILELSLTSDEISNLDASKKRVRELDKKPIITINLKDLRCVYCGEQATNLDHLFPFIKDKFPTGYFTEPANLVPCCSDCNQKKGAKLWHEYMDDLINVHSDEVKKKEYEARKDRLNEYCHKKHLPDAEGNTKDEVGKDVANSHALKILSFFDQEQNLKFKDWWDIIYTEVINALDDAQIQIDAFKAGIKYSILEKSAKKDVDNCFNKYFNGLVREELVELLWEEIKDKKETISKAERLIKSARKQATIAKHTRSIEVAKTQIEMRLKSLKSEDVTSRLNTEANKINDETNSQAPDKVKQKYYPLLEHGFRLSEDLSEIICPDGKQPLFDNACKAFKLGFSYAKSNDGELLANCIEKEWLNEVKVPRDM